MIEYPIYTNHYHDSNEQKIITKNNVLDRRGPCIPTQKQGPFDSFDGEKGPLTQNLKICVNRVFNPKN